jgi:hypothetical protein
VWRGRNAPPFFRPHPESNTPAPGLARHRGIAPKTRHAHEVPLDLSGGVDLDGLERTAAAGRPGRLLAGPLSPDPLVDPEPRLTIGQHQYPRFDVVGLVQAHLQRPPHCPDLRQPTPEPCPPSAARWRSKPPRGITRRCWRPWPTARESGRNSARSTLGWGSAASAYPLYLPVQPRPWPRFPQAPLSRAVGSADSDGYPPPSLAMTHVIRQRCAGFSIRRQPGGPGGPMALIASI